MLVEFFLCALRFSKLCAFVKVYFHTWRQILGGPFQSRNSYSSLWRRFLQLSLRILLSPSLYSSNIKIFFFFQMADEPWQAARARMRHIIITLARHTSFDLPSDLLCVVISRRVQGLVIFPKESACCPRCRRWCWQTLLFWDPAVEIRWLLSFLNPTLRFGFLRMFSSFKHFIFSFLLCLYMFMS